MTTAHILLDEHVGRVFERLLRECGREVEQAKDRFGEYTTDDALLQWNELIDLGEWYEWLHE